jgi:photosystem II PsbH protein
MQQKYVSKKVAPLQYFLRQFNSEAGRVAPGWGTAPFMVFMMLMLFLFLLIILQIYNGTILLDGVNINLPQSGF